jgi:serine protease
MSLTGGASAALDTAVRNSIADGITYSLAAGNGNILGMAQDACGVSPARVAEALTVGATDSSDRKASFSNYGTCLDLFAPGVGVVSAASSSNTATASLSGTSMAAPHVAGAAALYLSAVGNALPSAVASALTTDATAGAVASAGSGSPNKLLYTAGPAEPPPPPPDPGTDPDPSTPNLTSGVAHTATNGAAGTWQYTKISVPAGTSQLRVVLDGAACGLLSCNPDLDLYVRRAAKPAASAYDCRPALGSSDETCTMSAPAADWWYVGVYVYSGSSQKSYTVTATAS